MKSLAWTAASIVLAAVVLPHAHAFDFWSSSFATLPDPFSSDAAQDDFDWYSITPTRDLIYHECYGISRCARLEVPLDWLNASDSRTAAIAIRTLPAQVADDDPLFGGSILTNPGGPGGSGVSFLGSLGGVLQQYLDQPGRRYYEIVSFDPRGIGFTTPLSECFDFDLFARDTWLLQWRGNGPLTFGNKSIGFGLALVDSMSRQCNHTQQHWGDVMSYVNTPSVARDMVAIVDKIDELRKREAASKDGDSKISAHGDLKRSEKGDGKESLPRLQYIGFSYGTVLGNYFASLFPGRVGRLILDGVCDTDDFANGPGWTTNTVDTDEILDKFFQGCFEAGPAVCPLAGSFPSPDAAQQRLWEVVEALDEMPQAVTNSQGQPIAISGQDLTTFIGMVSYSPLSTFQLLSAVLQRALTNGSLHNIADFAPTVGFLPSLQRACLVPDPNTVDSFFNRREALSAVICGDGDSLLDRTPAWWSRYISNQTSTSRILGSLWSTLRFTCAYWPFKANWSFKGPFTTPPAISEPLTKDVPAAPLLFLSNVLDPVTPLRAARKMASQHGSAHVVAQDSIGHCALFSAPSPCTRAIVAEYLETGKVPASGESFCETTCGPWDEACSLESKEGSRVSTTFLGQSEQRVSRKRFPLGVQ